MVKEKYDVTILGGGLAGLCLAIQLKLAKSDITVFVAEKRNHPVPEAAFKVGEATVELTSYYLRDVLGLKEHLETQHLPKLGLRFFFTSQANTDIAQRPEMGVTHFPPSKTSSYQLDRGRLENYLGQRAIELGVDFFSNCKVKEIMLNAEENQISVQYNNETKNIKSKWVVDASGPIGILKRHLGISKEVPDHIINSAWFRIKAKIDIEDWTDNEQWQARIKPGMRWHSTNHFVGKGYWVWFIPLGSGSTSIGIVADPKFHPMEQMNRFDRAMQWLKKYEPQCALEIEKIINDKAENLQDFHFIKHFSYSCQQVFSAQRWAITGVAGVFHDPLYSPGSDIIAIKNTFITDLILKDLEQENIDFHAEIYNQSLLNLYEGMLLLYKGQYITLGNTLVFITKVVFDTTFYWSIWSLIFFHNKFTDLYFMASLGTLMERAFPLQGRLQAFFIEWNGVFTPEEMSNCFFNLYEIDFLRSRQQSLADPLSDDELRARLYDNIDLLETMAAEIFYNVSLRHPGIWPENDPLAGYVANNAPRKDLTEGLKKLWGEWYKPLELRQEEVV